MALTPSGAMLGRPAAPASGGPAPAAGPLHVVHVMPDLRPAYGGPVQALVGYIAAGALAGVRSTVLAPASAGMPNGEGAPDAASLRRALSGAAVVTAGRGGMWVAAPALLARLRTLLDSADLVHVHGLLNPVSSGAARLAQGRRPVVIGPFGTMSRYTFGYRRTALKTLYFRLADAPNVGVAAALHFTTAAERDEAAWHGIDFGGRAHVVPPPYEAPPRASPGPPAADDGTVLYLGRLHPVKGVDVLLEAWPLIRARRPGARLLIAGSGPAAYAAALRRAAASLGAHADSVEFLGFVGGPDKAAVLAAAGLFVLPSRHENFGIAVLDAVAAGVPAIVSPGVQLAPWIERERVGLVAERSAAAVAAGILRALDDSGLRERTRSGGADVVARDFSPRAVAPLLRAMYDAAMASGRSRTQPSP